MAKIDEVLIQIAEIKKDTSEIFRRLDKINGSIADYQVVKKRVDDLEEKTDKTNNCVKEISTLLSGIKIKIWSVAGLIGAIMGFIGVIVGEVYMIRIGSSCALSPAMAIGKTVETRRFIGSTSQWKEVSAQAIKTGQYLIVTPCINRNDGSGHIPSYSEWVDFIKTTCEFLISIGAKRTNARISIINEPMKFCTREKYAELINMAYPIVYHYGFLMSAGNEEFLTAQARGNMYQYILSHCQFDILDIHIQGSCDTKEKTEYWTNVARSWTDKPIDCTEAFYSDIATLDGWQLLLSQLNNAERIGCKDFCNVFNNLDQSAFPLNTDNWKRLSFCVNGKQRSPYWQDWLNLMEIKAGILEIAKPIQRSVDGMILPSIKLYSKGYLTELVEELLTELNYDIVAIDGYFDSNDVAELKKFQYDIKDEYPNIDVDGICGRKCYFYLIDKIEDSVARKRYEFKLDVYASPTK